MKDVNIASPSRIYLKSTSLTVQCKDNSVQCTEVSVQCTVNSVQCTI